ncbi:MAG: ATP-binding protein [Gammaproteobacteria bacterium]
MVYSLHPLSAARQNLRRLVAIRYVALAGQTGALALFTWGFPLGLPAAVLGTIIALFAALTLLTHWRIRHSKPISAEEFFGHLLVDVLALTVLLYFSGGATNPFVSYYLVPIIIGAIILPPGLMWAVTGVAIAGYSLLFFEYVPLAAIAPHSAAGINLHVVGMWFNFLISALLIAYFVVRMAQALREQEQKLNSQRQQQMENEQLLAIATVAAGAAHELGTPLNTTKLLIDELLANDTHHSGQAEDLRTINEQVELCRETLLGLTGLASDIAQPVAAIPVEIYVEELIDTWRLLRPEINATIDVVPPAEAVMARFHPVIRQSLFNLFNNSADASPNELTIRIEWSSDWLTLVIRDYGEGLTTDQLENIGQPMPSDKPGGLGLGLYLTSSSLSRHGGQVIMANAEGGGLTTTVELDLNQSS